MIIYGATTVVVGLSALIFWMFVVAYIARGSYKSPTGLSILYDKLSLAAILTFLWVFRLAADDYPEIVALIRPYVTITIVGIIGIGGLWKLILFVRLNNGWKETHRHVKRHYLWWRRNG